MLCSIKGCADEVTRQHETNGKGFCELHQSFYNGHAPELNGYDLLSWCCGPKVMDTRCVCVREPDNTFEIDVDILKAFLELCRLGNEHKKGAQKINWKAFLVSILHESRLRNISVIDLIEERKKLFTKKSQKQKTKTTKKEPVERNLKNLKSEAKEAMLQISVNKITKAVQNKLPTFVQSLGVSEEKSASINDFLQTNVGNLILMAALSGISTYIPIPKKFEKSFAGIAEAFRVQTMQVLGTECWDKLVHLITPFMQESKNVFIDTIPAEQSISEEIEIPIQVEV